MSTGSYGNFYVQLAMGARYLAHTKIDWDQNIERFSFEYRKTKTKLITLANQKGHRQYSEPIKTRSNYMQLTQSAGKCMRARYNWFWFYF